MKTPEQLKGTIRSMAAKKNLRAQEVLQMFLFERILGYGGIQTPQSVNRTIKRIVCSHNSDEVVKAKRERREPVILPDFSCHHLRHTFCTRLCEHETNLKVIQDIMGHRNIETTMDIYAEATDQKKQESFNNISKLDIF